MQYSLHIHFGILLQYQVLMISKPSFRNQHRGNIQPVHLFSINVLIDGALGSQIFAVNEIYNGWGQNGAKVFNQLDLIFLNMTRMWGFMDLILQDVDGFIFTFWNSFYLEKITQTVAVVVMLISKVIGFVIVLITYILSKKPCTYDVICDNYYLGSIYYQLIPFLIHFLLSMAITYYIMLRKYKFSKIVPIGKNTKMNKKE